MLFHSTSSRKKILRKYRLKEFPYLVVSNFLGLFLSNPIIQQRKQLINQFLIVAKMKGKLKPNKTKPNQSRTTFAIISTTRFLFLFLHSLFCLYLFTLFASLATIDFSSHGIVSWATYRRILFRLQTLFVKYPTKNKEIETFFKFWKKKQPMTSEGGPSLRKPPCPPLPWPNPPLPQPPPSQPLLKPPLLSLLKPPPRPRF